MKMTAWLGVEYEGCYCNVYIFLGVNELEFEPRFLESVAHEFVCIHWKFNIYCIK